MGYMAYPIRSIGPSEFPGALTEIPDPPRSLSVRGTLPPREHKILAVVGSRHPSTYGMQAVDHLIGGLRGLPLTIISGLAIGIDGLAHRAALAHGLNTLAIPGSGLDDSVLYPRRHADLAREILTHGGALLSEFAPGFRATRWSFIQRNRIMAGMSDAVLIIEAQIKSGSLVTARLATDYNRDVLAVPGSIFSKTSEGPHLLITLGATPITCADDIREALRLSVVAKENADLADLSSTERQVLALLREPLTRDALIARLNFPADEANALIMLMELRGYISATNGTYVRSI